MKPAWFLVFALSLFPGAALAANPDLHLGSFDALWCNYYARIDVQRQDPGTWIFHGNILIHGTGQYDPVWIEQYANNSLRIIRYLQGSMQGETQVVQTYPPEEMFLPRGFRQVFHGQQGYGIGCDGTRSEIYVWLE